jgi:hypothetical protein
MLSLIISIVLLMAIAMKTNKKAEAILGQHSIVDLLKQHALCMSQFESNISWIKGPCDENCQKKHTHTLH